MNPTRWSRVSSILSQALDLPETQRPAFVADAIQREPELRTEVLALFEEMGRTDGFLEEPAHATATDGEGSFGPYRVIGELGEGGMGVVYLAERSDGQFTRRAAIKRVGRTAPRADVLRRFRDERQILARLDHPHIARLLDAGVDAGGIPYLVMEHVEGVPLTSHCRDGNPTVAQRLRLFLKVCQAVQHAHQNLVIHRDIKPGNILVTAAGEPKLLDFGIAKVLGDAIGGDATETVNRALTLDYASPEQVRGDPVTTASDVYSLGVVLYELLADAKPYEVGGRSLSDAVQLVCASVPPPPSRVAPDPRRSEVAGDLDSIVRKAMEKSVADRYASVTELAADVSAHLDHLPVKARRPSFGYLARKFVRRHRVGTLVGAVVLVLVAGGLAAVFWQARVAERERARAQKRFQEVRQLANYVIFDLQDTVAKLVGSTELRKGMVQKSLQYLDSLAAEAESDTALLFEIAGAYERLGNVLGNPEWANLGDRDGAVASYDKAGSAYRAVLASQPWQTEARRALARFLLTESRFYGALGQEERARRALSESRLIWESLLQSDPHDESNLSGLASSEFASYLRAARPRSNDALSHMRRALAIFQKLYEAKPSDVSRMRDIAVCHRYLITFYLQLKENETALEHARLAGEMDSRRMAADPDDGQAKLDYSIVLSQMGVCKKRLGFPEEAARLYLQSLAIRRELWESDRANVHARDRLMYMLAEAGRAEVDLRRWEDARRHLLEAIEHGTALHGKISDTVPQETLIRSYADLGRVARGLKGDPCPWFRKSVAMAPTTPQELETYQYRVAVKAALESAREGLKSCAK